MITHYPAIKLTVIALCFTFALSCEMESHLNKVRNYLTKVIARATSNLYSPALICKFGYVGLEAQNTGSKTGNFHVISIGLLSISGKKLVCH